MSGLPLLRDERLLRAAVTLDGAAGLSHTKGFDCDSSFLSLLTFFLLVII